MYQEALGKPVNDAGDLYGYKGVNIVDGRDSSQKPIVPVAPLAQQPDITGQMAQLKKAQLAAAMAGLDKQKNASLSNLSAEKSTIEPAYQKQKIAADVTAQQGARSFDEYMAQRGGGISGNNKSGIAGQGTLLNTIAYQGQKGALDQAEASAISDNARRVTGVENAYQSDVQGANAGVEAQYLQAYINQVNQDRQFNQQDNQFNQNFGLQKDQYQSGLDQWQKSFDTGNSQWGKTFDQGNSQFAQNYDLQNRQLAAEQQNQALNRAASAARASNSGPSVTELNYMNKQNTTAATNDAFNVLNNLANQGKSRTEVLNYLNQHSSDFVDADYDSLLSRAQKAFTWDKNSSGTWFNTTAKKDPNE
jgi:hypothetical protein